MIFVVFLFLSCFSFGGHDGKIYKRARAFQFGGFKGREDLGSYLNGESFLWCVVSSRGFLGLPACFTFNLFWHE